MKAGTLKDIGKDKPDGVKLVQDVFGYYYYEDGRRVKIKRFTWTNRNHIQVQVINYGARVISIKYPDRKGKIDDIVLGFDDLAGYIHYKQYYFGATIGRMSNVVINSKFKIDDKEYHLIPNMKNGHHRNGGPEGFDQVIWKTWVNGKKVFMTHLSPHGHQGYPGNLLVQLSFELSPINDFKIDMVAYSTEPTIVNLTNLLYLNLAGHNSGPDCIYKHIVTVNCNCYTTQDEDGFCSEDIWNVVYTPLDIQVPVVLGKFMGLVPNDGFNQNMCVNRGVTQEECFVARIRYPPSGRLVEVYSNQYGVQFDTANHFCKRWPPEEIIPPKEIMVWDHIRTEDFITLNIIDYLQKKMFELFKEKVDSSYRNFKEYVRLLIEANYEHVPLKKPSTVASRRGSGTRKDSLIIIVEDNIQNFTCSPEQLEYLETLRTSLERNNLDVDTSWLRELLKKLIFFANTNAKKSHLETALRRAHSTSLQSTKSMESGEGNATPEVSNVASERDVTEKSASAKRSRGMSANKLVHGKSQSEEGRNRGNSESKEYESVRFSVVEEKKEVEKRYLLLNENIPLKMPSIPPEKNIIPSCYTSTPDKIVGKGGARYERHGGVAFQTQNYPNCPNIESFPSCILKPGEKYRHTITYKFWIRPGDPSKWIIKMEQDISELKRNLRK